MAKTRHFLSEKEPGTENAGGLLVSEDSLLLQAQLHGHYSRKNIFPRAAISGGFGTTRAVGSSSIREGRTLVSPRRQPRHALRRVGLFLQSPFTSHAALHTGPADAHFTASRLSRQRSVPAQFRRDPWAEGRRNRGEGCAYR